MTTLAGGDVLHGYLMVIAFISCTSKFTLCLVIPISAAHHVTSVEMCGRYRTMISSLSDYVNVEF